MSNTEEILEVINVAIREEHGNRLQLTDKLIDSGIDSFGITMVLLALDEKYAAFSSDWVGKTEIPSLTIQDLIDRVQNASN